jgi:type IV pilus assembly protein PilV
MLNAARTPLAQEGGSLFEVLVAIALFSFGLLGLFGALGGSVRAIDEARLRSEASHLAHAMIAEMWTSAAAGLDAQFAANGPAARAWQDRLTRLLPAPTMSLDLADAAGAAGSRSVVVTITWLRPGSTERHRYVAAARIGRNP